MSNSTSKTKVLHVFANLNIGGAETRTIELIKKLDRSKFDIHFLVHNIEKGFYEFELDSLEMPVHHLRKTSFFGLMGLLLDLDNFFRVNKYDIIHNHITSYGALHHYYAYKNKINIRIAHSRSNRFGNGFFKNIMRFIISYPIRYLSTHRLAVTKEAGELIFGNKEFFVLKNTIDDSKYKKNLEFRNSFRKRYNISDETILLGHIGRFTREKNHKFIIKLLKRLLEEKENYCLVLVGDGKLRDNIAIKTKKMGIQDKVIFINKVDNSVEVLNGIDVLIFPSLYEGLPGVLLEAQAIGCPVIFSSKITKEAIVSNKAYRIPLNQNEWIRSVDLVIKSIYPLNNDLSALMSLDEQADFLTRYYCSGGR